MTAQCKICPQHNIHGSVNAFSLISAPQNKILNVKYGAIIKIIAIIVTMI